MQWCSVERKEMLALPRGHVGSHFRCLCESLNCTHSHAWQQAFRTRMHSNRVWCLFSITIKWCLLTVLLVLCLVRSHCPICSSFLPFWVSVFFFCPPPAQERASALWSWLSWSRPSFSHHLRNSSDLMTSCFSPSLWPVIFWTGICIFTVLF